MAVKGIFTSDSNIPGSRKGDFASAILQMFPTGSATLFALTSGMQSADAVDPIITWFEESHISGRMLITASAGLQVTLVVDDGSPITANTIALVEETGEFVFISAVSTNNLTVTRGFANTTATTISNATGFHLQRIGTTFEESSSRPTGVANLGYMVYNMMQIFRNSWDISRTAKATQYHTGDIVAKNKRDCMQFHSEDIERSLWFGKRWYGTLNGRAWRMMNGVLSIITTNITAAGGTTTYAQVNTFLQTVFEKNIKGAPNERIAFCGNGALTVLNNIARLSGNSTTYITPGQTEFGIKVNKWMTPFGDITLMTHPLFNENPNWTKNIYVLHPGAMRMRYLSRTQTDAYDRDGTRAGVDGDFGVLTTECSVEYGVERTGAQMTGLTAAA